ncbi:MAG: hypothetical protein DME11_00615 [Candidatus Rokuibacteriota bacterium]|nr:MAG: hypothetical protein DME11_00615 [Candidatus Rokubacteria bacterium]
MRRGTGRLHVHVQAVRLSLREGATMIRRLPSVVALILTAGTAGLVTGTASHAAQATLGCPGTVQTGEQLATGITVDVGTTPLGAYSLTVTYDPTVLTIASVEGGNSPSSRGRRRPIPAPSRVEARTFPPSRPAA